MTFISVLVILALVYIFFMKPSINASKRMAGDENLNVAVMGLRKFQSVYPHAHDRALKHLQRFMHHYVGSFGYTDPKSTYYKMRKQRMLTEKYLNRIPLRLCNDANASQVLERIIHTIIRVMESYLHEIADKHNIHHFTRLSNYGYI